MTKRTAHQQRMLELKAKIMAIIANKMFTFKQTGIDGFVKKQFMPAPKRHQAKAE